MISGTLLYPLGMAVLLVMASTAAHRRLPPPVAARFEAFSGGIGQIDHDHLEKATAEVGMLVVKIGGPAYRIGMGGGAASSFAVSPGARPCARKRRYGFLVGELTRRRW